MNNKPYTYLIGWKEQNKWYYGVRYANNCNPKELWVTYFTSSTYVKHMYELFGDPDVIQIRRTFDTILESRNWEHTVLKRINVVHNEKWLNKTDNISFDPKILRECKLGNKNPCYGKFGSDHPHYGIHHSDDVKHKISIKSSGVNNPMYGKTHKLVICPHCGKSTPVNMMNRWHFDKCKHHPNYIKSKPKPKYIRSKYIYIFMNTITGEYTYTPMIDFSKKYNFKYTTLKSYFNKGCEYKNWIRL